MLSAPPDESELSLVSSLEVVAELVVLVASVVFELDSDSSFDPDDPPPHAGSAITKNMESRIFNLLFLAIAASLLWTTQLPRILGLRWRGSAC